jgi:hypothetical protein
MNTDEAQKIRAIYNAIEESEPDISTERLLAMTVDVSHSNGLPVIDVSDVCEALCINAESE